MEFKLINPITGPDETYTPEIITAFLYTHLEQYGDEKEDILKAITHAMNPEKGGNIIVGLENEKIVGTVVLNNTGMKDFHPENLLVYIAVDNSQRGKGYGKKLMEKAIAVADGNLALHVEPDNPAKALYEKLGFTNKYLEMRLIK
ncbi:GNAT family N-acetyltransferase [Flavobacterium hibernum]|uniref:GNAT family acetyltransferase n=1 Tax=Flavobacterium hibernum TaxID=37752 RepID=A0A0D0EZA9_9FLAO|nr:GNAT family N-acetyltransferase [Flavobacterium hibernum]KIO50967.1 GNAT family acetyltransferase [Flavobacterium hibernum]OXA85213.1 N-acetyltransferase [Flavobacterium hibernum]PTT04745.1 N-acetyltransferase [Flavobacterium sp. HMWF030]STO11334.1 putative acetyltransferase [Flavobacterium hibernum]